MIRLILLFLLITKIALPSFAQEGFYFSGVLGVGTLDDKGSSGDKYDNELTYGLRGGITFAENFSAGLFLKRMTTRSGAGPETTAMNVMVEATYYLSGTKTNTLWFSGLLGITQLDIDERFLPRSKESGTSYGASLGYQFMINSSLSLSPQLTYLYIQDAGLSDYSDVSGLINVSFWF